MKEYTLSTGHGGRPWDGVELIGIQQSALLPLAGYFGDVGVASAIQGIKVTGTTISAGYACIQHATDGWKVVAFAGASGVTFPYYLQVTKTSVTKVYPDTSSRNAYDEYTATHATPGGTPSTLQYLKVDATGTVRYVNLLQGAPSTTYVVGSTAISVAFDQDWINFDDPQAPPASVTFTYNFTGAIPGKKYRLYVGVDHGTTVFNFPSGTLMLGQTNAFAYVSLLEFTYIGVDAYGIQIVTVAQYIT